MLTRTPGPQVDLYKAHSGIKWWSSEKLEPRIPQSVNLPFGVCGFQSGCTKCPLDALGFECSQHRRTPRPSVERIRRKALRPFGSQ